MTKEELQKVREWADREIAAAELPSAWYQLMKLREALDAILGGIGGSSSYYLGTFTGSPPTSGTRSPSSGRH